LAGDVNADGTITVQDVTLVLAALINQRVLSVQESDRADMDRDGVITIRDAVLMLRSALSSNVDS
jgi:hypothetical protein